MSECYQVVYILSSNTVCCDLMTSANVHYTLTKVVFDTAHWSVMIDFALCTVSGALGVWASSLSVYRLSIQTVFCKLVYNTIDALRF